MESISRRELMGMGAATLLATTVALPKTAQADFEEAAPNERHENPSDLDMYRTHTPLSTINELRRQEIDACEDYVCEDDTIIEKIWVQCRAVLDSLGRGNGACHQVSDTSFELYKHLCNFDTRLAEVYVKSPIGMRFTAMEAAMATGYTEEECAQMLADLAHNGALLHVNVCGLDYYQHQRFAHGIVESSLNLYQTDGYLAHMFEAIPGSDTLPFPTYYPLPINSDIVVEEKIYEYDDIEGLLQRHEVFCVSPCQCRYFLDNCNQAEAGPLPPASDHDAVKDFICADGHHLEKCVTFGEEAQFYIDNNIGRQIDRDECREILRRQAEDEGCILQSCYTKYTEVICCCDSGCSSLPGTIRQGIGSPMHKNVSHYDLVYDKDACLKCGSCVDRCVVNAIEIDGDGYPTVASFCVRCGQCCFICPADARKLTLKDLDQIPDMPEDLLDYANKDCMWRYESGWWPQKDY